MNRRIKAHLKNIRDSLDDIERMIDKKPEEISEEDLEPIETVIEGRTGLPMVNWSAGDEPSKDTVYLNDLKKLTELKGIVITGQVSTVFDLKSYVKKDGGGAGLMYRLVLTDDTGGVTVVAFDDMATKLKEHPIGTYLRITNAWKMKANKNNIMELHVGNFAKIEVVE